MEIKRIIVNNFRSYKSVEVNNLELFNLFIGKNNSGKSNLFRLLDIVFNKKPIDDYKRIFYNGEGDQISLSLEILFSESELNQMFSGEGKRSNYNVEINNNEIRDFLVANRPVLKIDVKKQASKNTALESISFSQSKTSKSVLIHSFSSLKYKSIDFDKQNDKQKADYILQYLNGGEGKAKFENFLNSYRVVYIPSIRGIDIEVIEKGGVDNTITKFSTDGKGITLVFRNYLNNRKLDSNKIKKNIIGVMSKIFPELSRIQIEAKEAGDSIEIHIQDGDKIDLPLSFYGTGVNSILLIIADLLLYTDNEHVIYCIEELENNIHPELQKRLINVLKNYSLEKSVQFLISTHSPYIIDSVGIENIYHVSNGVDGTMVKKVSSKKDAFTLLDEMGAMASDILQSNLLVLVDGVSDKLAIKEFINIYDPSINLLNFVIFPCGGDETKHIEIDDLLKLNRNIIRFTDSEKEHEDDDIKKGKKDLQLSKDIDFIVTEGRAIENFFSIEAIKKFYGIQESTDFSFGKYHKLEDVISKLNSDNIISRKYCKVRDGGEIVKLMTKKDIPKQVRDLIDKIRLKST